MKVTSKWIVITFLAVSPLKCTTVYAESAGPSKLEVEQSRIDLQTLREKYYKNIPVVEFDYGTNVLTQDAANNYITTLTWLSNELQRELPLVQQHNVQTGEGKWLREWMEQGIYAELKRNNERFDQQVTSAVRNSISVLEKAANFDNDEFLGNYSNEAQRLRFEEAFSRTSETLHAASILQQALGGGDSYIKSAQRVDELIISWNSRVASMSSGRSLPKDIGDESLTKTASAVLANPKYGIGQWQRLIVNSAVRPGERIETQVEQDKLVTIVRRWQEYQVTTVELEEGKHFLYYNTLKNFSQAPGPTPVNTWILGKRVKGGEISSANL